MVAPLKPWFQTPAGLVRIQSDRRLLAAIATLLPHPRLRCGKFALKIQFDVILSANVAQRIILEIVFPSKYPLRAPSAFILGKAFAPRDRTRHFMDDGSCCLFLPGVDEAWDSSISSALDPWLDQVLLFIARQMIFDHLGRWPGDEWEHGFAAYSQHVSETVGNELAAAFYEHRKKAISPFALCPCGSTETFRNCHQTSFKDLNRALAGRRAERIRSGDVAKSLYATPRRSLHVNAESEVEF